MLHGTADSPADGGAEVTNVQMARDFAKLRRLVSRWKPCTTREAATMTFSVARRSTATSYSGCRRSCWAIFATDCYHGLSSDRRDVTDEIAGQSVGGLDAALYSRG